MDIKFRDVVMFVFVGLVAFVIFSIFLQPMDEICAPAIIIDKGYQPNVDEPGYFVLNAGGKFEEVRTSTDIYYKQAVGDRVEVCHYVGSLFPYEYGGEHIRGD